MGTHFAHSLEGTERTEDILTNDDITFDELLLSEDTLLGLKACGFRKPSPIQLKALPLGKCGFDLIVEAKSGTGKTAVFGVIALEMLVMSVDCQVVIIAPTREIATQIGHVIKSIGVAYKGLEVEVVIGGTNLDTDIKRLQNKKYQILIGSPGRMKHLIKCKVISLDTVRLFVLDEADKLMEECFQYDINYIFSLLPERKQVIVASATYTQELRDFLSLYMRSPSHICPYSSSILIGVNQFKSVVSSHLNTVRQSAINLEELKRILSEVPFKQCLVFCNYQSRTRSTFSELCKSGWPSEYLASSQTQQERLASLQKLQEFACRVLVATDLAARGIDAANVDLIINLDIPYDLSTYLHRIGRAGRYGSKGTAITIVPAGDESKFLTLFEKFGDGLKIKPLRVLSSHIPVAVETNLKVTTLRGSEDNNNSNNLKELLLSVENNNTKIESFDNLIDSLNIFQSKNECLSTFDSLLESFDNFNNSSDGINDMEISSICYSKSQPVTNVLKYIHTNVKNVNFTEKLPLQTKCTDSTKCDKSSIFKNDDLILDHIDCRKDSGNFTNTFIPYQGDDTSESDHSSQAMDVSEFTSINYIKQNNKSASMPFDGNIGKEDSTSHENVQLDIPYMPCVSVDDYLQWKSQLAFTTQFIQQCVYMHTLYELNKI